MAKQASKACLSLIIVLSLLANYSVSAKSSDKSRAPTASESENKSISPESLPVLPDPDSPTTEAQAVDETLSPTYFSVPPSADIPEVETKSDETLTQENVSTLSNADEPTELQIDNGEESLVQELASPPPVNIDPTLETIGDENINTSLSPSNNVDNFVLDIQEKDNLSQGNISDHSSTVDLPAVRTKESTEDLSQESTSLPPSNVDNSILDIGEMDNLSQENTSDRSSMTDPSAVETKESIEDLFQENTSLPPSNVDNSVLDIKEMDNFSQENISDRPSMADPPAVETKESTEDLFQENASFPPSNVDNTDLDIGEMDNFSQENTSNLPSMADPPTVETKESIEDFFQENTSLPPLSLDVPALETSDDESESLTQDNQFLDTYVNVPAPETTAEQDITTKDYSLGTPPNTEFQNLENEPELNDYRSIPKTENPTLSEEFSFPEADPTIQMTPSYDSTFDLAPTSQYTILPSNYKAEDEPVEPYEAEEDSWDGGNGAMAGVLVGACVIGVGGFVYQKRRKDNIRAQYHSLAKKEGV